MLELTLYIKTQEKNIATSKKITNSLRIRDPTSHFFRPNLPKLKLNIWTHAGPVLNFFLSPTSPSPFLIKKSFKNNYKTIIKYVEQVNNSVCYIVYYIQYTPICIILLYYYCLEFSMVVDNNCFLWINIVSIMYFYSMYAIYII